MDGRIIWSQEKYDEYEGQIKRYSFLISKTNSDIRDLKGLGYNNTNDKVKDLRKKLMYYHKERRMYSSMIEELEKVRQKQTTLF